uniref:NADH-ubiquinone oxidoreductase chain 3 n=1 Tax=Sahlbergotettix salicicola TaxID=2937677 RepID=A0A9E9G9U6_9HEMI|nr:NADH dehydrogenase subunit 3 [Sahlbergotettix salicicola]WAP91677.1 NADH dehydrogenase subunit 3 [Sahlbergotettix salicicola]
MYLTMMHTIMIMMIILLIMFMLIMISKKSIVDMEKLSPFECGFNPMSNKRLPFSIHFFLVAVIFLIFDIEIIIILPMIITMKYTLMKYWLLTSVMFILVLMMGLYHEWYNGMLKWTK